MTAPTPSRDEVMDALEQLAQHGVPAAGAAALFDVGTTDYLRYFEREVLDELIAHGGATCKLFEGAYGAGKTHLLQLLQNAAERRGMAVVRTDLSQALSLVDWRPITQHILQHLQIRTASGETVASLPRVLEVLAGEQKLDVGAMRRATFPHAGFAKAMALMCEPTTLTQAGRELLARYLVGERIGVGRLRENGVTDVKHPLSDRNAELVIKTVLSGLSRLGVPGTLLLFDETESNFQFRGATAPRSLRQGANLLRRLIDATASGSLVAAGVMIAVLPGFVSQCAIAYPALGQRLQLNRNAGIGWRAPVIPIEAVCSVGTPEQFLDGLIDRVDTLMQMCDVNLNGQRELMRAAGTAVLSRNAGSGYRRQLVKQIASLTLDQL